MYTLIELSTFSRDQKIKNIVHEYYKKYCDYDIITASIWLDSQNLSEKELELFKKFQKEIAPKYGL